MKSTPDNPAKNSLGAGVTSAAVMDAISKSGYPLQTIVAERLSQKFDLREEWGYVDRDTKALRTIDLLASHFLYDIQSHRGQVRPQIDLVIECKKSELPFVFFSSRHRPWLPDFPVIAGLNHKNIVLTTDDDPSTWTMPILNVLGLDLLPFISDAPHSNTFSKCVRKAGSELDLSGDESYNGIVLPLIKAVAHFEDAEAPTPTHMYFDAHLTIPLAIIDGPMLLVETENGSPSATLTPWVRVGRHEFDADSDNWRKDRLWAIDVVHVDYLNVHRAAPHAFLCVVWETLK